jgi:hypothetical protein
MDLDFPAHNLEEKEGRGQSTVHTYEANSIFIDLNYQSILFKEGIVKYVESLRFDDT